MSRSSSGNKLWHESILTQYGISGPVEMKDKITPFFANANVIEDIGP
jgi:hypothetical protein